MGNMGRLTSMKDLPPSSAILGFIRQAKKLNDDGVKLPPRPKSNVKKELVTPSYLLAALKKNKKALAAFEAFSYSHKKEYVEWLTEAKTDETRAKRLATTIEWLTEGKARNWKYMRK